MRDLLIGIASQNIYRDVIAAVVGACVGSFLNVLALRTLAEQPFLQTIFGFSQCPKCQHRLGPPDLIPVLSFLMLKGKCRYCQKAISWQYPVVELVTAAAFLAVLYHFQISLSSAQNFDTAIINTLGMDAAMITFFCILIAVCITDFKEKLIPHEITYPAIVVGIAFSAFMRGDLLPSLAGVGISYVLFDFLAFYGLKLYYYTHQDDEGDEELERIARAKDKDTLATLPSGGNKQKADEAADGGSLNHGQAQPGTDPEHCVEGEEKEGEEGEEEEIDPQLDETFAIERADSPKEEDEEFEVMGGGDAVLAALIAAWIGLMNLGITLLFGFMFGSLMGSVYVAIELHRRGTLNKALRETALITLGLLLLSEGTILIFAFLAGHLQHFLAGTDKNEFAGLPWLAMMAASIFGGVLLSTIKSGRDASKPFPFGPALAAGAVVAVFMAPTSGQVQAEIDNHLQLSDSAIQVGSFLKDMVHN